MRLFTVVANTQIQKKNVMWAPEQWQHKHKHDGFCTEDRKKRAILKSRDSFMISFHFVESAKSYWFACITRFEISM